MNSNFGFPIRLHRYPEGKNYRWELVAELYARLRVSENESIPDEIDRIGSNTVICRASKGSEEDFEYENDRAPVYRLGQNGHKGAVTGLIFVTLNDGFTFEDCHDSLAEAGFVIEKQSPTGGGWLQHQSGSIKTALSCYLELSELEAIQTIEPQVLLQSVSKSSRRRP